MYLSETEVKKLKVAELKQRLKSFGLETHGLKADLVDRLLNHLNSRRRRSPSKISNEEEDMEKKPDIIPGNNDITAKVDTLNRDQSKFGILTGNLGSNFNIKENSDMKAVDTNRSHSKSPLNSYLPVKVASPARERAKTYAKDDSPIKAGSPVRERSLYPMKEDLQVEVGRPARDRLISKSSEPNFDKPVGYEMDSLPIENNLEKRNGSETEMDSLEESQSKRLKTEPLNLLLIKNLTRPLREADLRALVTNYGEITNLWLDAIKTEDALAAKNGLQGIRFPEISKKTLETSLVDPERAEQTKVNLQKSGIRRTSEREIRKLEIMNMVGNSNALDRMFKPGHVRPERNIFKNGPRSASSAESPMIPLERFQAIDVDTLFYKTKTRPSIYFLPKRNK